LFKEEDVVSAGIEVVGSAMVVIEVEDDEEIEEVDEVGALWWWWTKYRR
jgi:hypothetical protein